MTNIHQVAVSFATALEAADDDTAAAILADLDLDDTRLLATSLGQFYLNGVHKYAEQFGLPPNMFVPAVLRDLGLLFAHDPSP